MSFKSISELTSRFESGLGCTVVVSVECRIHCDRHLSKNTIVVNSGALSLWRCSMMNDELNDEGFVRAPLLRVISALH